MFYFQGHKHLLLDCLMGEVAQTKCSISFVLLQYCCKNALERLFKYSCLARIIPLEMTGKCII